jgi:hypothetical protein
MESEKYQKELFVFDPPKKAQARFGSIFPRADLAITLTPEKMVFAAIGVIMLIVVFFALGVEKGRNAAYVKFTETKTVIKDIIATPIIPVRPAIVPVVVTKSSAAAPIVVSKSAATDTAAKINPQTTTIKAQAVFDKTKPYTVVAVTFSREDLAIKEVGKLRMAGLDAFVYYKGPYYVACVGSFQNKEAAGKILNKIKQMHRDAYVKLR